MTISVAIKYQQREKTVLQVILT